MSKNVDDLLAGAAETPAKKAAKKAAPAAAKKAAPAAKKAAPAAAKKAAPAAKKKKEGAGRGAVGIDSDSAKAILKLKTKKPMSYADAAEKTGLPIRTLRRTARALRDAGKIELTKEGTVVSILVKDDI